MKRDKKLDKPSAPRSIHRKIYLLLEEARRERTRDIAELADNLVKKGYLDYTYFGHSSDGKIVPTPCKKESIESVIAICADLDLLEIETATLTSRGVKAVGSLDKYNGVLRESISENLKTRGASVNEIRRMILKIFTGKKGTILPTCDTIYDELGLVQEKCPRNLFRTYLGLLSASGGIHYSQKRIYIP